MQNMKLATYLKRFSFHTILTLILATLRRNYIHSTCFDLFNGSLMRWSFNGCHASTPLGVALSPVLLTGVRAES
jgi:hypothetical protein